MFVDRYEMHIQAFGNVFYGKILFPILIFTKYNIRMRYSFIYKKEIKKETRRCLRLSEFPKMSTILILIFTYIIFVQDVPRLFLISLKPFVIIK